MPRPLDVRTVRPDELPAWLTALRTGFQQPPHTTPEEVAVRRASIDPARTQGAFDGDRCVGTFRTMPQQLTVPGGATVPACAVTNVTVSPSHRRRGLLTRMMANALRAAKERGDACSTLIAAEYPIYGRYGYGPATWITEWEVEVARTGLDRRRYAGPDDGGRVDLVDAAELRAEGPALHERFRVQPHRQGAVDRDAHWWQADTGALRFPDDGYTTPFRALYRDAAGRVQGMVTYRIADSWEAKLPQNTAEVKKLIAATPAAERALWRFLLSIDWVARVRSGFRAPDDVLPLLLPDPRAARVVTHADFLWLRPLDVPRLLTSRGYPAAGSLVLEVHDAAGLANGRFRLDATPQGATCVPVGEEPDLTLDVGELGALCLGDESAVRLAALGRLTARTDEAAALADVLLRTSRRPWCPDVF